MAKERRDTKNRILGKGEYQKADGRYMYRYTDSTGETFSLRKYKRIQEYFYRKKKAMYYILY